MVKKDLVERVSTETGLTASNVTVVLDAIVELIKNANQLGDDVILRGFGRFKVQTRLARKGRKVRTGEVVEIPERQVVKFKPYYKL